MIKEIRSRQLIFAERLIACLRGFTELNLRPVSYKYQTWCGSWYDAYNKANEYHKKMAVRYNNFEEIQQLENDLLEAKENFAQSQVMI